MAGESVDSPVRLRAFDFLAEQTQLHGETLPRELLATGFHYEGTRVPLIGPQGIFKPAILPEVPLSITTVPVVEGRERPYADEIGPDGLLRYRYRGLRGFHGARIAVPQPTHLRPNVEFLGERYELFRAAS